MLNKYRPFGAFLIGEEMSKPKLTEETIHWINDKRFECLLKEVKETKEIKDDRTYPLAKLIESIKELRPNYSFRKIYDLEGKGKFIVFKRYEHYSEIIHEINDTKTGE